jgi:hypothetical protein
MALRFSDMAIALGDLKFGTGAIAAHLTLMTGIPHTRGMTARILDDEAKRDSSARAREGPTKKPPDWRSEG